MIAQNQTLAIAHGRVLDNGQIALKQADYEAKEAGTTATDAWRGIKVSEDLQQDAELAKMSHEEAVCFSDLETALRARSGMAPDSCLPSAWPDPPKTR